MAAAAHPHLVEHTTTLALEEKQKLKKALGRFDMVFFTLCAFVGLDTIGQVAAGGAEGFTWLIVLAVLFVFPYALVMSEIGSTFTQEGGPYEWTKLAFGRFSAGIAAVFYWVTNPLWVGGSLAFIATDAWRANISHIDTGSWIDYLFKLLFIWFSIGVAIASIDKGKWIPTAGGFVRIIVLGFFTFTVIVYAAEHGVHGIHAGQLSPSTAGFLGLVSVILFNYVGFELQNGAAEEMVNPQRDVPITVARSGLLGITLYTLPILGILLVLPASAVTGIGGFIDAMTKVFGVYGSAAHTLLVLMTIGFIFALMTSGAVWMIGSDRIQAVAAYDGAFLGWFGVFNRKLGTPVRVNVMSGVVGSLFMVAALSIFTGKSNADAFGVVLDIAITTTLMSYLWIFPAVLKLRYTHGHVHRPYRVPGGKPGIWVAVTLITFFVALGSWTAVFPGTIEPLLGVPYSFVGHWHTVTRGKYELLAVGTLAFITVFAIVGYALGAPVRRQQADVELDVELEAVTA